MNEDVRFINELVPIKDSPPPEELFARLSGECGRWQISVCAVAFICVFIYSVDMELPAIIAPHRINFTCASDNSSKCLVNGTKCENFVFKKTFNMTTLIEKYSLVCHRRHLLFWIDCSFRLGMIVGNVLVGVLADKFGSKIASMIFVPSYCLTGFLLATSTTFEVFCVSRVFHALSGSSLYLLSAVSVCNNVGNKWRTFALGFTVYPIFLSWLTLITIPFVFKSVYGLIATISFISLPVLIPLLDSPGSILVSSNYEKADEAFRKISTFNGRSFSDEIKIRPVKIMTSSEELTSLSYSKFFRSKETRNPFLALLWLWFSTGVSFSLLQFSVISNIKPSATKIVVLSICCLMATVISVVSCHWIQHKIIMCVCLFLKNVCIAVTLLVRHYLIQNPDDWVNIGLTLVSYAALFGGNTALENLTPRMLPTSLRFEGVGILLSVFHAGRLLLNIPPYFLQRNLSVGITTAFFLILSPVSEVFCSLRLWNVHNRELPDFVEDCVYFERYFKPQRYLNIKENSISLQEIEIEVVKFNDEEYGMV